MKLYSELESDAQIRKELFGMILTDYEAGVTCIEELLGESVSISRVGQIDNIKRREKELLVLHELHIKYLKEWRAIKDLNPVEADRVLTKLLSIINSISGGLKNTG